MAMMLRLWLVLVGIFGVTSDLAAFEWSWNDACRYVFARKKEVLAVRQVNPLAADIGVLEQLLASDERLIEWVVPLSLRFAKNKIVVCDATCRRCIEQFVSDYLPRSRPSDSNPNLVNLEKEFSAHVDGIFDLVFRINTWWQQEKSRSSVLLPVTRLCPSPCPSPDYDSGVQGT